MLHFIDFLSILSALFQRKQPFRVCSKECFFVKDLWMSTFFSKLGRWRATKNELFYRYFTRISPRFSATLQSFFKFYNKCFTEKLLITAYDSSEGYYVMTCLVWPCMYIGTAQNFNWLTQRICKWYSTENNRKTLK